MSDEYDHVKNVCMNPLGPHFYVKNGSEFPEQLRDAVTDVMNQRLADLNDDYEMEITHSHIKAHTPITKIRWNEGDDDFQIDSIEVTGDWYSSEELHQWDH